MVSYSEFDRHGEGTHSSRVVGESAQMKKRVPFCTTLGRRASLDHRLPTRLIRVLDTCPHELIQVDHHQSQVSNKDYVHISASSLAPNEMGDLPDLHKDWGRADRSRSSSHDD